MATIKPFLGYRPRIGKEAEIAALPYDVYNRNEACEVVKKNPGSFLAIDRAETLLGSDIDTYDEKVYLKAHDVLWKWINDGRFIQDKVPCYYIYELVMDGRSQKGIVACASIDDYLQNIIKKHENTRVDKELDRIRHVDTCNAQTGPIFLAYRKNETLQKIICEVTAREPVYDFQSDDGIVHKVWVIDQDDIVKRIQDAFGKMKDIYIADGHHRCASAVKVGLKRREMNPDYTGEEEFNYFLSVLFPANELYIMDYNRIVKDLNGRTTEEFLQEIVCNFEIETKGNLPYKPEKKGEFSMYLDDCWYKLTAKKHILSTDAVEGLDVSVLQNSLLDPILGIKDPKTDKRIDFIGGIRGLNELEKRTHTDMKVAFAMYPTSIYELFHVADDGRLMPPKSTWFEPKLRSGLFIHAL